MEQKKRMSTGTRILLVFVLLAFVAFIIWLIPQFKGCSRPPAEELLHESIGLTEFLEESSQHNKSDELRLLLLKKAEFNVLDDSGSQLTVSVTAPDMEYIIGTSLGDSIEQYESTDEVLDVIASILRQEDYPTITREVTVRVENDDHGWYITATRELMDASYGGMISYYENLLSEVQ